MTALKKNDVSHIAINQLIRLFNARFFNPTFYEAHTPTTMMLEYESNIGDASFVADDVLDFCIKSDLFKTLGLTYLDLMQHFDMSDYVRLKEQLDKFNREKDAVAEKIRQETASREKELLGGRRDGRK